MSVLLRQAHGFEGFARFVITVVPDDLSFFEAPDNSSEMVNGGGAACDRCFKPGEREDLLACLDELLVVGADCLKGREPVQVVTTHGRVTIEGAFFKDVRKRCRGGARPAAPQELERHARRLPRPLQ